MNIKDWTKQLKELDKLEDIACSLYGKLLNDRDSTQESCDKAKQLCEAIQANRFSCQTHIIQHLMGDGSEYDEPICSSADDQSDEMDALGSIGWAEDEYYG